MHSIYYGPLFLKIQRLSRPRCQLPSRRVHESGLRLQIRGVIRSAVFSGRQVVDVDGPLSSEPGAATGALEDRARRSDLSVERVGRDVETDLHDLRCYEYRPLITRFLE